MNNDQNIPGTPAEGIDEKSKGFDPKESVDDDYYAVDNPKKEVISTIGDGEMHNEGLIGDGDIPEGGLFGPGTTEDADESQ